jgi:hypothetical protein
LDNSTLHHGNRLSSLVTGDTRLSAANGINKADGGTSAYAASLRPVAAEEALPGKA